MDIKKIAAGAILIFMFTLSGITPKSVHIIELENHYFDKPLVLHGTPSNKPLSETSLFKPLTEKLIFGYLTYWENKTDHLRYALLTDLMYFSCELADKGALGNCRNWPSAAPIDEAHKYGVRVHLVITGFSGEMVQSLIENESYKNAFFKNCWDKVSDAGADGINIDFEAFGSTNSNDLSTFFNDLGTYFHSKNPEMIVSAALPAVDWSSRWNLSATTEMDYFFLMLYDYHWKGADPGPVAPLYSLSPWSTNGICVEKSLNTYISKNGNEIKNKLIAGYPYYGIKWKSVNDSIPGTRSENGASVIFDKILSDYSAISSGLDVGSATPYKIWQEESQWYQLWYDNGESLDLKYAFANEKDVAGSGMWALNYDKSSEDLWAKIAENFVPDRSGSFDNPVKIENLPFEKTDNTYRYVSDMIDIYDCSQNISDTTAIDESGPEIVFELETDCDGTLLAHITKGQGETGSREDIDIHLLSGNSGDTCIFRNDSSIEIWIESGKYYITADSYSLKGAVKGGQFTITVDFTCDKTEKDDNDDTKPDDNDLSTDDEDFYTDDTVEEKEGDDQADSDADTKTEEVPGDEENISDNDNNPKNSGGCTLNEL